MKAMAMWADAFLLTILLVLYSCCNALPSYVLNNYNLDVNFNELRDNTRVKGPSPTIQDDQVLNEINLMQQEHRDASQFRFASYYASNMVLQRAPQVSTLWGFAPTGLKADAVKITFSGNGITKHYNAIIQEGPLSNLAVWRVTLSPTAAGGPFTITAELSGFKPLVLENVMFGDVWLCSGQSNMQFAMTQIFHRSWYTEQAMNYKDVRMINVQRVESYKPLYDFEKLIFGWLYPGYTDAQGQIFPWQDSFSAVCYLFGKYLYDTLRVPIGLVDSTWGGTPVECWSSPEALAGCGLYGTGGMSAEERREAIRLYTESEPYLDAIPHNNTVLWNAMIHPMLNMSIKGAIWYQGEANTNYHTDLYQCTFPAMISDWRKKFNAATGGSVPLDMPFGFVQIGPNNATANLGYPQIRWHQMGDNVTHFPLPNMFMAVAMDLFDPLSPSGPVHIRDKPTVAKRLSNAALNNVYEDGPIVNGYLFPTYLNVSDEDKMMMLQFSCGLVEIDVKSYDGFEVCCSSDYSQCPLNSTDNWVPSPIIKYNTTTVWISWKQCQSSSIVAYRYAWRDTPCPYKRCALYSDYSTDPLPTYMQKITAEPFFDCQTAALTDAKK